MMNRGGHVQQYLEIKCFGINFMKIKKKPDFKYTSKTKNIDTPAKSQTLDVKDDDLID